MADVAFLVGIVELFHACRCPDLARRNLADLRRRCGTAVMWLLEPAHTRWFDHSYRLFHECGLDILADNALHDQSAEMDDERLLVYHHLFYGLTESEKREVRAGAFEDDRRVIPWVFVGHKTPARCELARVLVEEVDPAGLLYLTDVAPITEDGPHLTDAGFQKALRRSRFQLGSAQNPSSCLEWERYRRSALAGCVPIRVVEGDFPGDLDLPFPYLVVRREELAERLDPGAFRGLRSAFLEEYCRLPSLEEGLDHFIASLRGDGAASPTRGRLRAWL